MSEKASILTNNAFMEHELSMMVSFRIRSMICAPLWHDDDAIGLIYMDS